MFDIVGKRKWFFCISGLVILASIISLLVFGLKLGIEFSSGLEARINFEEDVDSGLLVQALVDLGYEGAIVQNILTEEGVEEGFLIRTQQLSEEEQQNFLDSLVSSFGNLKDEPEFRVVSSEVSTGTATVAGIAVGVAAVGILVYITWAFHRMPRPFRYGTCALVALLHDVVVVVGIFSLLGGIMNWEVNLMFITGILAVIGYSVNNTVVVFDRIRENLRQGISSDFEVVVNSSLVETLSRSLNTSLTTLAVVIALVLFVGVAIQNFAVVLLIGVIAGTYSSLFVAPQLLVVWEQGRLFGFIRRPSLTARGARRG
ncbi:MAG: protein translocase subunit SecF [Dehalococcoidales bacterium]|nr:MAG: protein translocase subunit SecF [Dehalococcoidales bacterium]